MSDLIKRWNVENTYRTHDSLTRFWSTYVANENDFFVAIAKGATREESQEIAKLIAAAPTMYDFVRSHAERGDARACEILEQINANS